MGALNEFFSAVPAKPLQGNSQWAADYAKVIRKVFHDHAARAPRTLQVHLGPSELGVECDRQVAGKMAQLPATNHVFDPWPSIRGTALHAYAEEAFLADNERNGTRWLTEFKVVPHPLHPGTGDLYDAWEESVNDHKFLGESSLAKVKSASGPPRKYVVQMLLYARGFRNLGLPVRRVVLLAYPATAASLDGMYVWERPCTPADDELLDEVFSQTEYRREWAIKLITGEADLMDVPAAQDDEDCYFCLAAETEVVTREGIKPIRELADGAHELLVPTRTAHNNRGGFKSAPVRAFGEQRLYAVNLRRYRATKTVYATAEHRWVLADGTVQTSLQLQPGDQLASVKAPPLVKAKRIPVAVAQGFTYGDGARGQDRRPATLAIYGRSEKDCLLEFFGPVETQAYQTPDGDKKTHLYGLPRHWKDLPPLEESRSFLLSWLAGYFAADGTVSKAGQSSISSADRASLEFVRDIAAICGIGYGAIKVKTRLGCGKVPTDLHSLDLVTRDLPDWFWILPTHMARAELRSAREARVTHWSVVSVEATDRVEEVYCATVPELEAFALADGLTTGNCPFYRPQSARDGGIGCPGHRAITPGN